jgi:glycerophosphoryl diester phosphodiesterase
MKRRGIADFYVADLSMYFSTKVLQWNGTIEKIYERELNDRVVFISFEEDSLKNVRGLDRNADIGFLYITHNDPIRKASELDAKYLLPYYKFSNENSINDAHENGLKVIVWPINTVHEANTYARMCVDGIASDRPDILMNL